MNDSIFQGMLNEIISHSSDPNFSLYLDQQIMLNSTNFDHLLLCIKFFQNYDSKEIIYYFLCTFRIWINSGANLDPRILAEIKNIFFSSMKVTSQAIQAIQISTQVQIFLKVYPVLMPNFWLDFLSLQVPIQFKLDFLYEFSDLFINKQLKKQHMFEILEQMKNDGSRLLLIRYLLQYIINEQNENSFKVLIKILSFIDPFDTNQSDNQIFKSILSSITENILPMILNDFTQMPQIQFNIIENKVNGQQIITNSHQLFSRFYYYITFLCRLVSTNLTQHQVMQQIIPHIFQKIHSIHQLSISLLNQLFDIQNSPLSALMIEVQNDLSINLNNDIYGILKAVSNFISSCSLKFKNAEISQSFYFPISLSLLKIPQDNVSLPILNFLRDYSADPANLKNIFLSLCNRLTIFYVKNTIDTNDFFSSLTNTIKVLLPRANQEMKIFEIYVNSILTNRNQIIQSIIENSELKIIQSLHPSSLELPLLSTMLKVLDIARDKFINFSRIDCVLVSCGFLFNFKPPLVSQQYHSIVNYMKYIRRVEQAIGNDNHPIFQTVFNSLFQFLIFNGNLNNFVDESNEVEQISEKMKNKFISITNEFINIRNFSKRVNVSYEQIISLVKTGNNEIVLIASKILSKIPDKQTKFQVFSQCLNSMVALYSSSTNQVESILSILSFIQYQNSSILDEKEADLISFILQQLFEIAFKYEDIMIAYLTTIQKVLDDRGINIFLQCLNKMHNEASQLPCFSKEVLSLISKIANIYIQHDQQGKWKLEAFCQIFDLVNGFGNFGEQNWRSCESEEVREVTVLLDNFFSLVAHSCHFLGVQKNMIILNYLENQIRILFELNSTDPLYNSIDYLYTLATFSMENKNEELTPIVAILIEKFLVITLSVFKIDKFAVVTKWIQVVEIIFKFNQKLMHLNRDAVYNILCAFFDQLPQSEQMVKCKDEYIAYLCSDSDAYVIMGNVKEIFQFLHDVCNPV